MHTYTYTRTHRHVCGRQLMGYFFFAVVVVLFMPVSSEVKINKLIRAVAYCRHFETETTLKFGIYLNRCDKNAFFNNSR